MGSFKDFNPSTGLFNRLLYRTVARDGDMKLVVSTGLENNLKPIEKAHSPNSVYVILRNDGNLKSINVFDSSCIKERQIDLDHYHGGMKPHVHIFSRSSKYHPGDAFPPVSEDYQLIIRANKLLKEYKL